MTHHYQTYDPQRIATVCQEILNQAYTQRGRATFALAGGRSPAAVIQHLAEQLSRDVLQGLHLFWVDERACPKGHELRNDHSTLAAWQSKGALPAHIHPMPAEMEDLEAAASTYQQTLLNQQAEQGFDLILLGMGEDGHVASCFPDHPGLHISEPVFAVYDSPKPPERRLSLSLALMSASPELILLVLGAEKGLRLAQALQGPRTSNPISLLPLQRMQIFCDPAAEAALNSGRA